MTNEMTTIDLPTTTEIEPYRSAGVPVPDTRVLREALDSRLADWGKYLLEEEDAAATTQATYAKECRRFLDWLDLNPQQIRKSTFIDYRTYLKGKYKPGTVNLSILSVRRFLDWLESEGHIPYNPAGGVKGVKDRGRGKTHRRDELTHDEIARVQSKIDTSTLTGKRDLAVLRAMAYGALRQIELTRATIGDYRTKSGRRVLYVIGKGQTDTQSFIVIHPKLEQALADWLAVHPNGGNPKAALFCSLSPRSFGEPLSTSYIRRLVKQYYKLAGIREATKTTHSLRHSAISEIAGRGSLLQAQAVGRHADPKTTLVYVHDRDRLENPGELLIQY